MVSLILLAALQGAGADTVRYEASFPNAVHHEAEVAVVFPRSGRDTLEVWMSRSSPGRYAIHEFAKNVYDVSATDSTGSALTVVQRDPYRWFVTGHRGGPVRFEYTLFADRADGTYSQVDRTHAHLNMPATFAWAKGFETQPISIVFETPGGSGWRAATQLLPTADSMRFAAPDLQYFLDSPTELSDFDLRTWTVPREGGGADTIRLAVHHEGTDSALDAYAEMAKKVVAEHIGIYGEAPRFDRGTYTFIADYLPWASGDGMEHRNSTILSSSASLERAPALLGTLSHEFAHAWNIERIRPADLEPFDFTGANSTDVLWYGEGFTSYYDDLTIRRAGLLTDSAYAGGLGGLVNAVVNANGRRYFSPMEMSRQAPFVDAATSIDPTNRANTFLSYYTWGAGIGLGLDLSIRERFEGKTLDGFMRLMWERYGRNEQPFTVKQPYTVDDLERTLGEYVGDAAWARDFFAKHVRDRDAVDYARLLAQAGILVRPSNPDGGTLGLAPLQFDSTGARVIGPTLVGTPVYDAGIDRGDLIVSVAGRPAISQEAFAAAVDGKRPGETVEIVFEQRGERRTATVPLIEDARLEAVTFEQAGRAVTDAQRRFRAAWLGSRAVSR